MYPQVPDSEYVFSLKAEELLRVGANTLRGKYAAFGISYATTSVSMASLPDCPPNLPPCDPYELIIWAGSRISISIPQAYNAFIFVKVGFGFQRRWMAEIEEVAKSIGPDSGVFYAFGNLFGRGPYTGVVEILADDERTFNDLVLRSTDIEGVLLADPHFVSEDSQRGMGDPEREALNVTGSTPG